MLLFLIGAKCVQLLKEIFVAKEIGIGTELDAFVIGLMIAGIGLNIIFSPLGYALLPELIKARSISIKDCNRLFNSSLAIAFSTSIVVVSVVLLNLEWIVNVCAITLSQEAITMARKFTFLLIPYFAFNIGSILFGVYLNALEKNFMLSVYQAFPALFTLFFFLININKPIYSQILGFCLGSFIAFVIMMVQCYKVGYRFEFRSAEFIYKKIHLQWIPLIAASLITSSNIVIDRIMAGGFGDGAISSLDYGNKLYTMFTTLAVTGVSIIYYPKFSEFILNNKYEEIRSLITQSVIAIFIPSIIIVTIVYFLSPELVKILFERGKFTAQHSSEVIKIMKLYIINTPILIFGIIGVRLLNAMQKNITVAIFGSVNVIVNIIFNILLTKHYGLAGIALSTSVVVLINAILCWIAIKYYFDKRITSVSV